MIAILPIEAAFGGFEPDDISAGVGPDTTYASGSFGEVMINDVQGNIANSVVRSTLSEVKLPLALGGDIVLDFGSENEKPAVKTVPSPKQIWG